MSHYSVTNVEQLVEYLLASPFFQTLPSAEHARIRQDVPNWSEDDRKWFVSAPQQRGACFVLAKLQGPSIVEMIMVGCMIQSNVLHLPSD